ncbi:hypothetical protein [Paraburkholderia elongata]|uniref:Uncharacterized protein n=1 Tax=Paraburkholderia elongata TaxID=2675747 RepID=A0A972NXW3_9BURK|nr:hypothetical protein [Paraburkholderia elongata]NPT54893.1 hypothetical protein [Paraburkholderia elongata]NPT60922.1 hypothetical protein [Paraburkholderia elongata]
MTGRTFSHVYHRPSTPDPASDPEKVAITVAVQQALQAIHAAHRTIQQIRPSDEHVRALQALREAQKPLEHILGSLQQHHPHPGS